MQIPLQGLQASGPHRLGDGGGWIGQLALELLQPLLAAAPLLLQPQQFLGQPLQLPLLLLQLLTPVGQLGLGDIPGAPLLAKTGLQLLLAALQGGALLLVLLLLLFPVLPLGHQRLHRRRQAPFIAIEGLQASGATLKRQAPLPPGGQQAIPLLAGGGEGGIGALQLPLQALPAGDIARAGGLGFRRLQFCQPAEHRGDLGL